jgi:1-acyl-sn-glycerol-3-phosphate acyltransferase
MSANREPPRWWPRVLASIRLVVFYTFSAIFIPIIAVVALLQPGGYRYYRLVRVWAAVALAIFGVRVEATGAAGLVPGKDYVLLVNHRSHFDSLAIVTALGARETRWVAKRELLKVPIFGYGLRVTGQILVDRKDHGQAVEALRANLGKHGATVVFFAEGERSASGALSTFKKGGAAFAIDAGLPVVPVAIAGSERVLPKHSLIVLPGSIAVAFGEPISTAGLGPADRERLTTIAHDKVRDLLARIEPAPVGI